jgi:putative ABC transport system ATP-binding protein
MDTIILNNICKSYQMGEVEVQALRNISLTIREGEFVAIMGTSGSGKSTLMNLLGGLDTPTSGSYTLEGVRVDSLTTHKLAEIRNQKIGFVFQGFNLLPRTSAVENVELPLLYDRSGRVKSPRKRAIEALEQVSLAERLDHDPSQLSGGQQQRVAIARALVNYPTIILADEPTGNLDSRTTIEVIDLFQQLNEKGITVIFVTHEPDVAQYTKRIIMIRDGEVRKDVMVPHPQSARKMLIKMNLRKERRTESAMKGGQHAVA